MPSSSSSFELSEHPHRRYNPLTRTWVLCSPHRAKRPWQGQTESPTTEEKPSFDPNCYLCPGNTRANGETNPHYNGTFVFDNDFAALLPDTPSQEPGSSRLLISEPNPGNCRVLCFSPKHNQTLAKMDQPGLLKVVDAWQKQYQELGNNPQIGYVQVFENKGAVMGCSNPHPHGQIWASAAIPEIPAAETLSFREWKQANGSCLLCDYWKEEEHTKERIVFENNSFAVLVPFWALWPYETLILPKMHLSSILEMDQTIEFDLAAALSDTCVRYDNLFQCDFPYSMGIHQSRTDGGPDGEFHFHFHFFPPLLRSATVKKFMVGYEMLAEPQRDITPEQSAHTLRGLSGKHYAIS